MTNADKESRLLSMAAKLLGIAIQTAQAGSETQEVKRAAALHDAEKLYPKLTITMPHGDTSAVRMEVVLCDPSTDKAVVRMIELTGESEGAICKH